MSWPDKRNPRLQRRDHAHKTVSALVRGYDLIVHRQLQIAHERAAESSG
jgi:hypothetical protein